MFQYSVTNDGIASEKAYLEPEGLPLGLKLTVSLRARVIAPKETAIFNCKLELDHKVITTGCQYDHEFLIVTCRVAHDSPERCGACKYKVRPREKTVVEIDWSWILGVSW